MVRGGPKTNNFEKSRHALVERDFGAGDLTRTPGGRFAAIGEQEWKKRRMEGREMDEKEK